MTSNIVLSNQEFNVVGKRPIRHDGYDKVTGKALYGADVDLPGLLHGKVLRSPHAHAKIVKIDTSRARAHPEVRAVVTSADLPTLPNGPVAMGPGPKPNGRELSNNVLAGEKALYKGHAVAALAATSAHAAEEALALIDVEYEVLPAVTDVEAAMATGAAQLHEKYSGNVASHNQLQQGDIEEGFRKADVIVEREYRTKTVHQGYIEPHTATAWWTSSNNRLTIWCSSQGHFSIRDRTAGVLGIPYSDVKVVPMEIGGGFGGKTTIYVEPVAAALSRQSGQPVKVTMSRADVLEGSGPTSGSYMKVKMGATNDGRLTAAQAELMYEAGAFPGSPVGAASMCIFSPYNVENILIDGYDVVNNKPKTTAYRAPGAPGAAFAAETVVDELCEKLSIDPLEFRIVNGAKEGTRRANGLVNPVIGCVETAQAAMRPRPLQRRAVRSVPRARRRLRILGQWRRRRLRHRQRQLQRHGQPDHRIGGHRRQQARVGPAVRGGARHPRRGREPAGGRHRLDRLHLDDRRQRRRVQDGLGVLRGGDGREAPDDRAGSAAVGDDI